MIATHSAHLDCYKLKKPVSGEQIFVKLRIKKKLISKGCFFHIGLHISRTLIANAFVESSERLNYTKLNYNGDNQIGVAYLQSRTQNGLRQTAAKAYLSPIKHRPNLDISLRSWVTKLLFNEANSKVKAVKFLRNKREHIVKVRKGNEEPEVLKAASIYSNNCWIAKYIPKIIVINPLQIVENGLLEVILAAGSFESPKLLLLSGIGPQNHLEEKSIKVIKVNKASSFELHTI